MDNKFFPQAFMPTDINHAKDIALTPDPNNPNKWDEETEHDVNQIVSAFQEADNPIDENSLMIDYGCGIGRISKKLIETTGCKVIGVDFSPNMLHLSFNYTNSPDFIICPQPAFETLIESGLKAHGAMAVWVLQHCENPAVDLELIAKALQPGGLFFMKNNRERYIPGSPSPEGYVNWWSDGVNVEGLVQEKFDLKQNLTSDGNNIHALYTKK